MEILLDINSFLTSLKTNSPIYTKGSELETLVPEDCYDL